MKTWLIFDALRKVCLNNHKTGWIIMKDVGTLPEISFLIENFPLCQRQLSHYSIQRCFRKMRQADWEFFVIRDSEVVIQIPNYDSTVQMILEKCWNVLFHSKSSGTYGSKVENLRPKLQLSFWMWRRTSRTFRHSSFQVLKTWEIPVWCKRGYIVGVQSTFSIFSYYGLKKVYSELSCSIQLVIVRDLWTGSKEVVFKLFLTFSGSSGDMLLF